MFSTVNMDDIGIVDSPPHTDVIVGAQVVKTTTTRDNARGKGGKGKKRKAPKVKQDRWKWTDDMVIPRQFPSLIVQAA